MSDAAAVVMALAAAAGAWAAVPCPRWWGGAAVVAAFLLRRPALLCLGVALATSALGARSWAGLTPPDPKTWSGVATLIGDPVPAAGGVRVVVKAGRARVEAWARGEAAGRLRARLAGERIALAGHIQPVPEPVRAMLARRHVAARLSVERVGEWSTGHVLARMTNGVRRTLLAGSTSLSPERRALFAGFVLGDDRDQPPEIVSDFRASGLAHLLAVSGQNVAFVLALASPLLKCLGIRTRLAVGLAVLVLFGTLTRWEPSVLRAAAMAGLALLAAGWGRPVSRLRVLALAVTGLLLVDPLLVGSVGFLLSVGASCGIALLAAPVTAILPGPRPVASVIGVTVAAQLGVAPVLLPVFGEIPVAALPANLLAVPAAGPLTLWGMAAGLPAGVLGPPLAGVLHVPTDLLVGWVAAVARHAAALPLGRLRAPHVAIAAGLLAVGWLATVRGAGRGRGADRRWVVTRRFCAFGSAALLVAVALPAVRPGSVDGSPLGPGARLWRRGGASVVVLDGARSADGVLEALRSASVGRLDVLVVCRPGSPDARVATPLLTRVPARLVLAPAGARVAGAQVPDAGTELLAGGLAVRIASVAPELSVEVEPAGA